MKLGVEEWLVRTVMAMYKHARTRVVVVLKKILTKSHTILS